MKNKILILSAFLFAAANAFAYQKEEIRLIPEGDTDTAEVAVLTVYHPDEPTGMAIIACPGGAYHFHAIDHEGHNFADWYTQLGITYGVLKYRLPHGDARNEPLQDAEAAVKLFRANAGKWKVNPRRVGIMGSSAGGHLAAMTSCLAPDESRPDFTILFYPVISMEKDITNKNTHNNLIGENASPELEERYSIEKQVTSKTPPAFILLSSDDGVSPLNSLRYATALHQMKIPYSLHIYNSGGHGWGYKDSFIYKPQWTNELEKWLLTGLKFEDEK